MSTPRHVIVGGGAAGFFGAVTLAQRLAELRQPGEVLLLEKGRQFLAKVRISGGGRCNVTHACFDPRELATRYPRGGRALIGPFHRFQPRDTVAWFEARGVPLKTEADGRMFPTTDESQTIIDALMREVAATGVNTRLQCGLQALEPLAEGGLHVTLTSGEQLPCRSVLLATGGCRGEMAALLTGLGHSIVEPLPSLFTFHIPLPWVHELAGMAVEVEATVPGTRLRERGPLLFTHWGASGPAVLRLSAWGARVLHETGYTFSLTVCWLPDTGREAIAAALRQEREKHPGAQIVNTPLRPLPARLWERLLPLAEVSPESRWATLSRAALERLADVLYRTELPVTGKSTHKAEFVTCGGVSLSDVNFRTMESRHTPGLYFAGELLDIDGITGGFNFQAAWTTGWIAGNAMAEAASSP